ncbi:proton/glutamate-aspartate symporter [Abditibacteriota bacterium]|nr:proton/glutamate-aspartate symporter [Abditibacteriota bacterium]
MEKPQDPIPSNLDDAAPSSRSLWALWHQTPLYVRIVAGMILGIGAGLALGPRAVDLAIPGKLILRVLGALAPALILAAIIHALMTAQIKGKTGARLVGLLLLNTVVAILIGLFVANILQPGQHSHLELPTAASTASKAAAPDTLTQILDNVPSSLLGPLGDGGKVIGVIFIAIAFGFALRPVKDQPVRNVEDLVLLFLNALIKILSWVVELVPLAVFGVVANIVGTKGFADFKAMGAFVIAVLLALLLQGVWYLTRITLGSWVRPLPLLRGMRDALVMAFSTGSSTITMPVTYSSLKNRVGLRDQSASMGALVGANFNNDGTALYEAMSALFISQMLGRQLTIGQQLMVVLTSVVASVGAAGIPEAGLVTMTLVFHAVGLPPEYIAILLTVDWFLDRSRTALNVMGDINVSCLLDGKVRQTPAEADAEVVAI